jgi:hypothetical protein
MTQDVLTATKENKLVLTKILTAKEEEEDALVTAPVS